MVTDSTRIAVVDREYHWQPIDQRTPRGAKLQLIDSASGVTTYAVLSWNNDFWTHWAPPPTFSPEERSNNPEP